MVKELTYSALFVMSYCALCRKDSSYLRAVPLAGWDRGRGTGEVVKVSRRMLCTYELLGLAVMGPWLAPGGPILTLAV